jgi:DNA-binding winged helix-turn-helix (wHTH) protein
MRISDDTTIALPGFELNLAQALLRDAAGNEVRLRPQAMSVLQFLARHAGRVVTKDELMQSVWAGTVVTDDSLVQCICEIRLALNDLDHRIVRTSPKRGYWLALPGANGATPSGGVPNSATTNDVDAHCMIQTVARHDYRLIAGDPSAPYRRPRNRCGRPWQSSPGHRAFTNRPGSGLATCWPTR